MNVILGSRTAQAGLTMLLCLEEGGSAHAIARITDSSLIRRAVSGAVNQRYSRAATSPPLIRRKLRAEARELEILSLRSTQ